MTYNLALFLVHHNMVDPGAESWETDQPPLILRPRYLNQIIQPRNSYKGWRGRGDNERERMREMEILLLH